MARSAKASRPAENVYKSILRKKKAAPEERPSSGRKRPGRAAV